MFNLLEIIGEKKKISFGIYFLETLNAATCCRLEKVSRSRSRSLVLKQYKTWFRNEGRKKLRCRKAELTIYLLAKIHRDCNLMRDTN